jgi:hypothetical protein
VGVEARLFEKSRSVQPLDGRSADRMSLSLARRGKSRVVKEPFGTCSRGTFDAAHDLDVELDQVRIAAKAALSC